MQLCSNIDQIRTKLLPLRDEKQTIALVPTMGALHQGHMRLVTCAQKMCKCVVVSIFVNPKQFGEGEDFDNYPRNLAADQTLLEAAGVDYCFAPLTQEMWPDNNETVVETVRLANILMGALRPGHFRGVASIVAKLFNIIQPTHAFFGEKDFQQLAVIRRMVEDLNFPVEIIGVPIARDQDGVAQSSRNKLLSSDERRAAAIIPQACAAAAQCYANGERQTASLISAARTVLMREPLAIIESIDLRDCQTLTETPILLDRPAVLLLSVRFGQVRLIDQHIFNVTEDIL